MYSTRFKTTLFVSISLFAFSSIKAQQKVKDGTGIPATSLPAPGSILELQSTQAGLRMPQVSLTSTVSWLPMLGSGVAATSPGMTVYNTNTAIVSGTGTNSQFYGILIGGKGEYYWDGFGWVAKGGNQAQTVETWIKASGAATQTVGATAAAATVLDFSAETSDRLNEFDLTTNTATIATSGIYMVIATVKKNTGPTTTSWGAALITRGTLSGITTLANVDGTNNNTDAPTFSGSTAIYFTAGEQVTIEVFRGAASPSFTASNATVAIVKLSN
ncbi:MAG TPA: hypothetical protein VGO58_00380 [Chitinophagaceae bacterium]|jgi:hypothetical protein|nr:hypothetical protein [Chitinophagaceae bacterium]